MKAAFLIPVYNHGATLEAVVQQLLPYKMSVIVVDDGNDEKNKAFISAVAQNYKEVILVTHTKNKGKGQAMNSGVKKAAELGFTHIFQLDADGQHDTAQCGLFLEESLKNPDAIINGYPQYDESAPSHRKNGREISNGFARFVTWNKNIRDVLCGFRIYPVEPYAKLLASPVFLDSRMGYDVDILVHLLWRGLPIVNCPVKVTYPQDGVSNFRLVRDNLHIAGTFTRLCLGMIVRIPKLAVQVRRRNGKN